jgi:glycosyltransferase involved in cell wall biosynthesis
MTTPPAEQELISVVLPTYNRERSIVTSIQSVLRQTWSHIEVIVVDDCSEDGTTAVVEAIKDPRVQLLRMDRNSGPSAARNRGIEASRGRWIAFQDSDDEWLPEKLALQMARIAELGPDCVAAYCGMAVEGSLPGRAQGRLRVRYLPHSDIILTEGDISRSLDTTSLVSTQMLVVRRDEALAIGGFDEDLQSLEDWDISIRLAARGRFAFVDRILVIQRFSPNSLTANQKKRAIARAQIIAKHGARMALTPEVLAQQYQSLAGEYRRENMLDEAAAALREARRLQPARVGLWARSLFLKIARLLPFRIG